MITLALIGVGKWGSNYLRTVKDIPSLKIKYICSGQKSLQKLPSNYMKINNYKKLAEIKDLDGIIIATPPSSHFEIANFFLNRGFNVLVEKPITLNYNDALKLLNTAKKSNKILMAGHIYLHNPAFLEVKKRLKEIGNIKRIHSEGMDKGPVRTDVSALWDWAPHDLSMCLSLLNSMPISVSGSGIGEKTKDGFYGAYSFILKFPKNILVNTNVSWNSKAKKRKLIIYGEKKTIFFDDKEKKIVIKNNNDGKTQNVVFSNESPLTKEVLDFVKLIKNEDSDNIDAKLAVNVIKILETLEKSAEQDGKEIKLN